MLLCIDSGRLMVFALKKKDEIDLQACEVTLKSKPGLSENNKYMFTLGYSQKGLITRKEVKLVLGTDSESTRRDWVFTMQLTRRFQSKIRDSVLYVNELKKLSILQMTMERQYDDMRKSLSIDNGFIETMKQQANEIEMPLQF